MKDLTFKCTYEECIERNGIECADQLREFLQVEPKQKYTIHELLYKICEIQGVTMEQLRSDSREEILVYTRHVIANILYKYPQHNTVVYIGSLLNRNHCTISFYLKEVDRVKEKQEYYRRIRRKLNL